MSRKLKVIDNVGFLRLRFEDIKRLLDSNVEDRQKVEKIKAIIDTCYE